MTEQALVDKEYHVGDGWRYRCWICGHQVKIDKPFPKTCPGCHAAGWWGHMVAQNNGNNGKDGVNVAKILTQKEPEGIMHKRILSQLPDAVEGYQRQNKGVYDATLARKRGRPRQTVPDDLIMELSGQGFSSRGMVEELAKMGYTGKGYKVIQRRLKVLSHDNGGDTS